MDIRSVVTMSMLAVLLLPGPTNTLLATSGAVVGFRRSIPLLVAELAGYNIAIAALRTMAALTVGTLHGVQTLLKVAAVTYLVFLSVKLWRTAQVASARPMTARRVFVTTLINPKAFIFALLIIPLETENTVFYHCLFSVSALTVGALWISLGSVLTRVVGQRRMQLVPRVASVALVVFAIALAASIVPRS